MTGELRIMLDFQDQTMNKIRDNKRMGIASTKSQINTHITKFEIEYLGYWITQQGIQPLPTKG